MSKPGTNNFSNIMTAVYSSQPFQPKDNSTLQETSASDILEAESAEIKDMKKKIEVRQRQLRVKGALLPYIRSGSNIVNIDNTNHRYMIRIPVSLRRDDTVKITARSEEEVYDKAYRYLFGDEAYTIRALFDDVLTDKENDPDRSSLTVSRYRQIWAKYYDKDPIADCKVTEIKASDLKKFFKKVTAGRAVSRKNFVNIKSVLNCVYDLAVDRDIITGNLARSVSCKELRFKAVDNSNVRYTDDDRIAILAYLDNMSDEDKSDYEYAIEMMFCLCIRIGELRALRWSDVDEHRHTITISREIVLRKNKDGKNRFIEVPHTKGGEHGARTLPLSDRAEKLLNRLRSFKEEDLKAEEADIRCSNKEYPEETDHIFRNKGGQPLDPNKFNQHLKSITKSIGIPYLSSHKIRFWSVTALARATGGDIQTVMYAAGHVDKNTTLHYIRAVKTDTQTEAIKACFT